jgi:hypothetical protein
MLAREASPHNLVSGRMVAYDRTLARRFNKPLAARVETSEDAAEKGSRRPGVNLVLSLQGVCNGQRVLYRIRGGRDLP